MSVSLFSFEKNIGDDITENKKREKKNRKKKTRRDVWVVLKCLGTCAARLWYIVAHAASCAFASRWRRRRKNGRSNRAPLRTARREPPPECRTLLFSWLSLKWRPGNTDTFNARRGQDSILPFFYHLAVWSVCNLCFRCVGEDMGYF